MDTTMRVSVPGSIARAPSVGDVDAIAGIADPVIRNLRITQTYHLLAVAFAQTTGPGANWCTFATWASRQAGQTIRGEDLLRALQRSMETCPEVLDVAGRVWRWAIRHALARPGSRGARLLRVLGADAFERASDAVARGNRKVFEEIAREFARFLPLCVDGRVAPDALADFLGGLRGGGPPEGQDHLRGAFGHYARALGTRSAGGRAELLLLANLEIGLHEQTRLQPEILEALEVPCSSTRELGERLLCALFPASEGWNVVVRAPLVVLAGGVGRQLERSLRALMRRAITELLMTLALPGGVVRLGRDLRGPLPEPLRDPSDRELRDLLGRFEPPPGDADGAGADDWSVLRERMFLITRLFRLRHEDAGLFQAPFTPQQVAAFEGGRVPEGEL